MNSDLLIIYCIITMIDVVQDDALGKRVGNYYGDGYNYNNDNYNYNSYNNYNDGYYNSDVDQNYLASNYEQR